MYGKHELEAQSDRLWPENESGPTSAFTFCLSLSDTLPEQASSLFSLTHGDWLIVLIVLVLVVLLDGRQHLHVQRTLWLLLVLGSDRC